MGKAGILSAYETGRGSILVRAKIDIEKTQRGADVIVVQELPYQVNKAAMIEKIADLVRSRRLEGIAALRDESDREGVRVVIELKREAVTNVILNQLYKHTPLQSSFGANMLALSNGRPELFDLKGLLSNFLDFRAEVVTRRTRFLLSEARNRAHILAGLSIAVANIDAVIKLIRAAKDAAKAREALMARAWPAKNVRKLLELISDPRHVVSKSGTYKLSEAQARGILDLRLQRLTALGRDEIASDLEKLHKEITLCLKILGDRKALLKVIRDELTEVRKTLSSERRTQMADSAEDIDDEDLIQSEDMVVTVTHSGYIKRVPLARYRTQRRGGKGRAAMKVREEDFATKLFTGNTHDLVLFFSSHGKVYQMKIWRLPLGQPHTRGQAFVNLLPLGKNETISSIMPLPSNKKEWEKQQLMFATRKGRVRRNKLSDFLRIHRGGKIAMKLDMDDEIISVLVCDPEKNDILLTSQKGLCVRFPAKDVRLFSGRVSSGVRGMNLAKEDRVISMSVLHHMQVSTEEREAYMKGKKGSGSSLKKARFEELKESEQFILAVSSNGFGKRTSSHAYRITKRGGKGITAMITNARNGDIVSAFPVNREDEIMLITDSGQTIRCGVKDIRIAGRSTQGVRIFTMKGHVVSVAHIQEKIGDENGDDAENAENGKDRS